MPTFDFANVLRSLGRTALSGFSNPLLVVLTLGSVITLYFDDITALFSFGSLQFPTVQWPSVDSFLSSLGGDQWCQFILYLIDYERLVEYSTPVLNFIGRLCTYLSKFSVSVVTCSVAVFFARLIHRSIRDAL